MALEEQLASQADNKQSQDKDQVPVAQMLDQLKVLRRQLASLDAGADLPAANSSNVWKAETKQLIHKLSALSTPSTTDTPADGHASTAPSAPQNSNLGSLDRRIAEMEEALGIKVAMLDEVRILFPRSHSISLLTPWSPVQANPQANPSYTTTSRATTPTAQSTATPRRH